MIINVANTINFAPEFSTKEFNLALPTGDHISPMKLSATSVSAAQTNIRVRGMDVIIDEPPARGGSNAGPTPPEMVLSALAGCTSRISNKIALANNIDIQGMNIEIEAAFDRRGVNLEKEVDIPLEAIILRVEVITPGDAEAIALLQSELNKYCPITKILRAAGTRIEDEWTFCAP